MINLLTSQLLRLLNLQPHLTTQTSARMAFHHAPKCKDPLCHIPTSCNGTVAYINAHNQVTTTGKLAETLRSRTDIIGLASWLGSLYLLTQNGEVYHQDGTLHRTSITFIDSGNHDIGLYFKSNKNQWTCYEYNRGSPNAITELSITPESSDYTTSHRDDMSIHILNGKAYHRWFEHSRVLTPYREWIEDIRSSPDNDGKLYQCTLEIKESLQKCIWDQQNVQALCIGSNTIHLVEFYRRIRGIDRLHGDYDDALEAIYYHNPTIFGDPIQDVKLFTTGNSNCHYVVLLEIGKIYLSLCREIVDTGSEKVIGISTLDETQLFLHLDTDKVRRYRVRPEGLVLIPT
jgi:hypothetical protein